MRKCLPSIHHDLNTSIAPDLMIVKVCVTRHIVPAGEEGVGQGATLPVKRVPVVVKQLRKSHSDVPSGFHPPAVSQLPTEAQGGRVAPGFEGVSQDVVHQTARHAR